MARSSVRDQQMRVRIAQEAARLMTEEGIHDFYAAKRKAAQHLGAPDTRNMPRNLEVEAAPLNARIAFGRDAGFGADREPDGGFLAPEVNRRTPALWTGAHPDPGLLFSASLTVGG